MITTQPTVQNFTWCNGSDVPRSDWTAMLWWLRMNPGKRILVPGSQVIIYTRTDEIAAFDRSTWSASRLR